MDLRGGATTRSLTHVEEQEKGRYCRIAADDNCLQSTLRELSLSRRTHIASELTCLGRALRELREHQRLSREQLAAAVGAPERRIEALEAGRLDPGYVLLVRLEKALRVAPGALFARAEQLEAQGAQTPRQAP